MLTVTTYGKSKLLALHSKDDEILAPRGNFTIKEPRKVFLSAYIHGDAMNLVGYDIPVFIDGEMTNDDEQDCLLKWNDEERECILIQWDTDEIRGRGEDTVKYYRGLICLKTDDRSIEYARRCSKEKKSML